MRDGKPVATAFHLLGQKFLCLCDFKMTDRNSNMVSHIGSRICLGCLSNSLIGLIFSTVGLAEDPNFGVFEAKSPMFLKVLNMFKILPKLAELPDLVSQPVGTYKKGS